MSLALFAIILMEVLHVEWGKTFYAAVSIDSRDKKKVDFDSFVKCHFRIDSLKAFLTPIVEQLFFE